MIKNVIFILISLFVFACSKPTEQKNIEQVFTDLKNASTTEEILRCYSKNSKNLITKIYRNSSYTKRDLLKILPLSHDKITWKHSISSLSRTSAKVTIQYTDHFIENRIGLKIKINMIKEGNAWKIDISNFLNRGISRRSTFSPKDYIKSIRQK